MSFIRLFSIVQVYMNYHVNLWNRTDKLRHANVFFGDGLEYMLSEQESACGRSSPLGRFLFLRAGI